MRFLAAALLIAAAASPALANANAPAPSSLPSLSPDAAADPVIREVDAHTPLCEAVLATQIRPPARALSLGLSTKLYQCWQLTLTSRRGLKALEAMERLKSLQDALRNERANLTALMLEYAATPKPNPPLLKRLAEQSRSIGVILTAYSSLSESGARNGLIKVSGGGIFSGGGSISAALKDDDYTMANDDSQPQCPSPESQK